MTEYFHKFRGSDVSAMPPSSRGLGHLLFTEATGIRLPLGVARLRLLTLSKVLLVKNKVKVMNPFLFLPTLLNRFAYTSNLFYKSLVANAFKIIE